MCIFSFFFSPDKLLEQYSCLGFVSPTVVQSPLYLKVLLFFFIDECCHVMGPFHRPTFSNEQT